MATKEKRVSVNTLEKLAKENFEDQETVQWLGVDIVIKHTIPLRDALQFTKDIVDVTFMDDGTFVPEISDFAVKSGMVEYYSNLTLPENLEKKYELIYKTSVSDVIYEHINQRQLDEIVNAANRKIKYLCDSDVIAMRARLNQMLAMFEDASNKMQDVFSGVSKDDMQKLVGAMGSGVLDEDKIVSAYLEHSKAGGEKDSGEG